MANIGAYSRHKMLEELNTPLFTNSGDGTVPLVYSPQDQKQKLKRNTETQGIIDTVRASAVTEVTTAGAGTYTAAQLLTGAIVRDCAGASRTDTLDTAANIVAAIKGCQVGDTIRCYVVNGSDPITEIITLAAGTGGAFPTAQAAASRIIGGGASKTIHIRITNVTSPAYEVFA